MQLGDLQSDLNDNVTKKSVLWTKSHIYVSLHKAQDKIAHFFFIDCLSRNNTKKELSLEEILQNSLLIELYGLACGLRGGGAQGRKRKKWVIGDLDSNKHVFLECFPSAYMLSWIFLAGLSCLVEQLSLTSFPTLSYLKVLFWMFCLSI